MDQGFWALFQETGAPEFYLLSREDDREPSREDDREAEGRPQA